MTRDTGELDSGIGRRRAAAAEGTRASYHDKRGEIIAAAVGRFRERGYRRTSLAEIAAAVGTDRATLYYYFGSKEELLYEAVTPIVTRDTEAAEAIRDSADPAPVKLRRLVTNMMASYNEHYPLLYVYLQENLSHVEEGRRAWAAQMRAVNRRYEAAVEAIIREGIAAGSLRPLTEPRVLAYGVMGLVSWTHRWFNPRQSPVDAASIGEAYAEVVLGGLAAEEAGA